MKQGKQSLFVCVCGGTQDAAPVIPYKRKHTLTYQEKSRSSDIVPTLLLL